MLIAAVVLSAASWNVYAIGLAAYGVDTKGVEGFKTARKEANERNGAPAAPEPPITVVLNWAAGIQSAR